MPVATSISIRAELVREVVRARAAAVLEDWDTYQAHHQRINELLDRMTADKRD